MSDNGYIRIPRSLVTDPLWQDLSLRYQHIFLIILTHVCYKPIKINDHGVIIELQPGQICITYRELIKLSHSEISKNDIERSIKQFILCGFLRQEVRHTKSILSICHKDTLDLILQANETGNETRLRQDRDKIETEKNNDKKEKKENKENKKEKPTASANAASLLLFFNLSLSKNIPEVPEPCKEETAIHFDVLLQSFSLDEIQKVITFSHQGFWAQHVHTPSYLKIKFSRILAGMRREQHPPGKVNGNSQKPLVPEYKPVENPKFQCRDPFTAYGIKRN